MQYLVIMLDDTSVSYCHCDNPYKERRLISLDDLRAGMFEFSNTKECYYLGFYNNAQLRDRVNEALSDMKADGTLGSLCGQCVPRHRAHPLLSTSQPTQWKVARYLVVVLTKRIQNVRLQQRQTRVILSSIGERTALWSPLTPAIPSP